MRLSFFDLSPAERRLYFLEAAQRRGVLTVILEKDFWVCWMLALLFDSRFGASLVFKGGTSLSKVFNVIDRFSEDIDLSVSPETLNLSVVDPSTMSRTQANRWMEEAEAACSAFVSEEMRPELESRIREILGAPDNTWLEFLVDPQTRSPVLLFYYPCGEKEGYPYLRRSVKLEFGSLTDQQPTGRHPVRPWAAIELPQAFPDWRCEVTALELERTFWEKATILHVEWHRPADRPTPDRFSRHYADMAALGRHELATRALSDDRLRERVVTWKSRFFGSAWAHYELAKPGSFRLLPAPARAADLRRDYQVMRDMYLSSPPDFDSIMAELAALEGLINGNQ